MALDSTHQQRIRDWIAQWHGGAPTCALCGQTDWSQWDMTIVGVLFEPPRQAGAEPLIALMCRQCGQTLFLDARTAQLPPVVP